MPRFEEAERRDVFRGFNFLVDLGGEPVAACRKVSGLKATVEVVKFRDGSKVDTVDECYPGRCSYEPVTLEGGVTNDPTFEAWANALVHNEWSASARLPDGEFRREVAITVLDIDGTPVKRWVLHNAWASEYNAFDSLDASGNEALIESIVVAHEGFERQDPPAGGDG